MYHIDRHLTKELRKKKGIKGDIPVEFLYDVRPAYTGIGKGELKCLKMN